MGWSLTRRQTDAAQGTTLPPFPSFHSLPQPPRRMAGTEGVAAAITGPATLGHWDSQRCGSWTTFYATLLERRTAATLVFLRSPFLRAAAASVVHLPGDCRGGATPGEQWPRPCVTRPSTGVRGAPASRCATGEPSNLLGGRLGAGWLSLFIYFFLFFNFISIIFLLKRPGWTWLAGRSSWPENFLLVSTATASSAAAVTRRPIHSPTAVTPPLTVHMLRRLGEQILQEALGSAARWDTPKRPDPITTFSNSIPKLPLRYLAD